MRSLLAAAETFDGNGETLNAQMDFDLSSQEGISKAGPEEVWKRLEDALQNHEPPQNDQDLGGVLVLNKAEFDKWLAKNFPNGVPGLPSSGTIIVGTTGEVIGVMAAPGANTGGISIGGSANLNLREKEEKEEQDGNTGNEDGEDPGFFGKIKDWWRGLNKPKPDPLLKNTKEVIHFTDDTGKEGIMKDGKIRDNIHFSDADAVDPKTGKKLRNMTPKEVSEFLKISEEKAKNRIMIPREKVSLRPAPSGPTTGGGAPQAVSNGKIDIGNFKVEPNPNL